MSDTTTVAAGAMWTEYTSSMGSAYGTPTLPDGTFLDLPRSINLSADWARDKRRGWMAFATLDHDLPAGWELRGSLSAFHSEARLLSAISQGPFDPEDDYSYIIHGQLEGWDVDVYSLDGYAAGPMRLFGREHELMVGFNGARTENDGIDGRLRPEPLQISHAFDHDPTTVPEGRTRTAGRCVAGVALDGEPVRHLRRRPLQPAEPLHLIVGARASTYSLEDPTTDFDSQAVVPYAALTWDFNDWGTVYASYARIYAPNTWARDADGQLFEPHQGHNYEVGVKGGFLDGRLDASLALYRLEQRNVPQEDFSGGIELRRLVLLRRLRRDRHRRRRRRPLGRGPPGLERSSPALRRPTNAATATGCRPPPARTSSRSPPPTTCPATAGPWAGSCAGRARSTPRATGPRRRRPLPHRPARLHRRRPDGEVPPDRDAALLFNVENVFDKTYHNGISVFRHGHTYGPPRSPP